jgi:hypothetical protein
MVRSNAPSRSPIKSIHPTTRNFKATTNAFPTIDQDRVSEGLVRRPASKVHHAAFDAHLIGIDPDYRLHVSERLLIRQDGPLLEALNLLNGGAIPVPKTGLIATETGRLPPGRRQSHRCNGLHERAPKLGVNNNIAGLRRRIGCSAPSPTCPHTFGGERSRQPMSTYAARQRAPLPKPTPLSRSGRPCTTEEARELRLQSRSMQLKRVQTGSPALCSSTHQAACRLFPFILWEL